MVIAFYWMRKLGSVQHTNKDLGNVKHGHFGIPTFAQRRPGRRRQRRVQDAIKEPLFRLRQLFSKPQKSESSHRRSQVACSNLHHEP